MGNKISLAGDLGSGKSTVAKLLIEALGAEYYSTGAIVRAVAEKRGMTVADLNVYMETHPEIDKEIDDGLVALSADERPLVIDSRMAWHFTEGTFKVYLSTDAEVAALRIMNAGRAGESTVSLSAQVQETLRRRESEKKRYSEKYGVDITNLSNYDLVVDTTYAKPEEISACILAAFRMKNEGRRFAHAMICPERLSYIDDAVDAEQIRTAGRVVEADLETGHHILRLIAEKIELEALHVAATADETKVKPRKPLAGAVDAVEAQTDHIDVFRGIERETHRPRSLLRLHFASRLLNGRCCGLGRLGILLGGFLGPRTRCSHRQRKHDFFHLGILLFPNELKTERSICYFTFKGNEKMMH